MLILDYSRACKACPACREEVWQRRRIRRRACRTRRPACRTRKPVCRRWSTSQPLPSLHRLVSLSEWGIFFYLTTEKCYRDRPCKLHPIFLVPFGAPYFFYNFSCKCNRIGFLDVFFSIQGTISHCVIFKRTINNAFRNKLASEFLFQVK